MQKQEKTEDNIKKIVIEVNLYFIKYLSKTLPFVPLVCIIISITKCLYYLKVF